jgi:Cu+-exporting ATPase
VAPGFFRAHGLPADVYYEAVIFIIALVLVGNTLESRAKGQTAAALQKLVELQPKTARVVREEGEVEVPLGQLQVRRCCSRAPRGTCRSGWSCGEWDERGG